MVNNGQRYGSFILRKMNQDYFRLMETVLTPRWRLIWSAKRGWFYELSENCNSILCIPIGLNFVWWATTRTGESTANETFAFAGLRPGPSSCYEVLTSSLGLCARLSMKPTVPFWFSAGYSLSMSFLRHASYVHPMPSRMLNLNTNKHILVDFTMWN